MKYIDNKSLIFEQGTNITVTKDPNFLLRDVPPYVRELIKSSVKDSSKPKYIEKLKKHLKKFPNVAFLYKLLADEYTMQSKEDLFIEFVLRFHKNFPNDFYAKLNRARVYMLQNNPEGVATIYGEDVNIIKAFPNRKEFHYSEILDFLHFAVRYTLFLGLLDDAIRNEMKIAELEPNGSTHKHAKKLIERFKMETSGFDKFTMSITTDFNEIYPQFDIATEEAKVLETFRKRLSNLKKTSSNVVVELQILADKHPNNPYFKLFIVDYHGKFDNPQAYVENINILNKVHPKFLMAKLKMAQLLLTATAKQVSELELVEKAFKVLDENLEFGRIKPHRELYHIEEALMFQFVALQIWIKFNKLFLADNCLKTLEQIDINSKEYFYGKKLIEDYNRVLKFNNHN